MRGRISLYADTHVTHVSVPPFNECPLGLGPARGQGLGPRGDAVSYCLRYHHKYYSTSTRQTRLLVPGDQRCPIAGGTGPFCIVLALIPLATVAVFLRQI